MSYRSSCVDCDRTIGTSNRYCPCCGAEQPWPDFGGDSA